MKSPIETVQQILKFCQLMIALLWIYQGLIPKLIFQAAGEQYVWQQLQIPIIYIPWMISLSGIAEIIFGNLFLWITHQYLHWLSIFSLTGLLVLILFIYPEQTYQAFNPVVMNVGLASLSIIALCCIRTLQQARPE
ncbi:DoxX-like family protein [Acinetobacter sp. VNH17]|uniref:DoxX-like family protein n=1 Tax=Acinetobacter thutiue TaxID=2998078 RepID=A0ABT7WQI4_9GAMM|nr:DoxX-like family protein [Acinetobacter thutiue]MCY6412827.1 DoxX-like family protein [Acinetobacter thutiue]MDN0014934.1 DoxX-like family protein [Acinetobacter thutiue]